MILPNVKIMVELNGFETNDNDYFTIQCGPTFGHDDILDAVAPNFRNSIYAEVDFYDLTYMRCDYMLVRYCLIRYCLVQEYKEIQTVVSHLNESKEIQTIACHSDKLKERFSAIRSGSKNQERV